MTQYIIVDTSVARACGSETSTDATAAGCRDALKSIEKADISVVICPPLLKEWKSAKATRYARQWLTDMVSRARFVAVEPEQHSELRRQVRTLSGPDQAAAMKDLFLMESALECGQRVLSRDDAMRRIMSAIARDLDEVAGVHWVNPGHAGASAWLDEGAPDAAEHALGQGSAKS
jgi:hypothetical protein